MTSSITSFPDRVDDVDKFSTLFSPATPRPSPVLQPADTDSGSMNSRQYRPNTLASDPAAFVSVSAAEDPLALFDFALPPPAATPPVSSLRFFGKFAQEAKEAAERNKRYVLDELLLHEDDPLYWLKDQGSEHASEYNDALRPPSEPPEAAYSSLLDLDHDFFTSKPIHDNISASPDPSLDPRHSPTRSPTHPAPATLAPPVAITSNELSDPLFNDNPPYDHNRSNSYQTLSSLSSRWMSSLLSKSNSLSSSPSTPTITDGSPSLDTLINAESSFIKPRARSSDPHRRSISQAQTMPSVHLSHGTPFGQHHSRTSPFAPHVYSPPSGAPGFAGEQYDWDKGFSAELGLEIERDHGQPEQVERGRQVREMVHVGQSEVGREDGRVERAAVVGSPVHIRGVGDLMEKKSGHVQLDGRKAVTSVVLDVDLADMIRPHLPALARLPRTWTLLYSLDQHGISLNTLYARCEFSPPRLGAPNPQGALLVVKDDGDAVFGVWMGEEGVHPSHGKGYYGSGESFMWKYADGKFEVFKWTGRNDYVALCEPEFISFGGGDGQYGLYLDESLLDGSSAPCTTFGNAPLCSSGPKKAGAIKFECVGLEVWSIGP